MDFMATVMDVLDVERPEAQAGWAFDGQSVMPILTQSGSFAERGIGWMYQSPAQHGYRYGQWKYVNGSQSCSQPSCREAFLYDLSQDLAERNDVKAQYPEVFAAITRNFTEWLASVVHSRNVEQGCAPLPTGNHLPDII
jgi:arylsulfatase A-like enzyme